MSKALLSQLTDRTLAVALVGLGYVGLPLAVFLSHHFRVIGFDLSEARVRELASGRDHTCEVEASGLAECSAYFTTDSTLLREAGVIIVAVPTPVDHHRHPDLNAVRKACVTVGRNLRPGAVVVFESTVYPGVTEEICVPILEQESGLRFNEDFTVGYSPERINPGDKIHALSSIVKVVAGSNAATVELLAAVYGSVVTAGIHKASSIRVAEAAKVIENTQRDLNIALMNELALIFHRLGIDTVEVLEAAGTKWNFLPFRPGLVGGHCIGVDPYYLTYKAEDLGYRPHVILAGRRINDAMGAYVAQTAIKMMIQRGTCVKGSRVGLLGLTFKEDVPDLRNSKVYDIICELREFGVEVLVHDPLADPAEARREYGVDLKPLGELICLDALILAVAHKEYRDLSLANLQVCFSKHEGAVLLDVKSVWNKTEALEQGYTYWRL